MTMEEICQLIQAVSDSRLTKFSYEENGVSLKLEAKPEPLPGMPMPAFPMPGMPPQGMPPMMPQTMPAMTAPAAQPISSALEAAESAGQTAEGRDPQNPAAETAAGNVVASPLVGIFYSAPAEDAAPFVKVGDVVKKGQIVAIVEAMKLMNEIECDYDGTVAEILVKNGQAVEYGQPMFRIV